MQVGQTQLRETGARFLLPAACAVVIIAGLKAASGLLLPFLSALLIYKALARALSALDAPSPGEQTPGAVAPPPATPSC